MRYTNPVCRPQYSIYECHMSYNLHLRNVQIAFFYVFFFKQRTMIIPMNVEACSNATPVQVSPRDTSRIIPRSYQIQHLEMWQTRVAGHPGATSGPPRDHLAGTQPNQHLRIAQTAFKPLQRIYILLTVCPSSIKSELSRPALGRLVSSRHVFGRTA